MKRPTSVPAKADIDRQLVGKIAMDIGKEAISHLRVQYPDVYGAMSASCRTGLRNCIHNQIMAALDTVDADEIERRLQARAEFRRRLHRQWDGIRRERS